MIEPIELVARCRAFAAEIDQVKRQPSAGVTVAKVLPSFRAFLDAAAMNDVLKKAVEVLRQQINDWLPTVNDGLEEFDDGTIGAGAYIQTYIDRQVQATDSLVAYLNQVTRRLMGSDREEPHMAEERGATRKEVEELKPAGLDSLKRRAREAWELYQKVIEEDPVGERQTSSVAWNLICAAYDLKGEDRPFTSFEAFQKQLSNARRDLGRSRTQRRGKRRLEPGTRSIITPDMVD